MGWRYQSLFLLWYLLINLTEEEESSTAPLLDLSSLITKILILNVALGLLAQTLSAEGGVWGGWTKWEWWLQGRSGGTSLCLFLKRGGRCLTLQDCESQTGEAWSESLAPLGRCLMLQGGGKKGKRCTLSYVFCFLPRFGSLPTQVPLWLSQGAMFFCVDLCFFSSLWWWDKRWKIRNKIKLITLWLF